MTFSSVGDTVLLVAGGWDTPNYSFVSSVELLRLGDTAWSFSTPFPRAQAYIRWTQCLKTELSKYIAVIILQGSEPGQQSADGGRREQN